MKYFCITVAEKRVKDKLWMLKQNQMVSFSCSWMNKKKFIHEQLLLIHWFFFDSGLINVKADFIREHSNKLLWLVLIIIVRFTHLNIATIIFFFPWKWYFIVKTIHIRLEDKFVFFPFYFWGIFKLKIPLYFFFGAKVSVQ